MFYSIANGTISVYNSGMRNALRYVGFLFVLVILVGPSVSGQTSRLETYQSNFSAANLQTKLEVLRAANHEDAREFGPLYRQALQFVLSNASDLPRQPMLREIAMLSTERVEEGEYTPASAELWRLFQTYDETSSRIRVLEVLGSVAGENEAIIEGVVDWVRRQHIVAEGGGRPDLQVLSVALETLGRFADPRANPVLLDAILYQYPRFVTDVARESMRQLEGDSLELALRAVRGRPMAERRPAFSLLLDGDFLEDPQQMEFARIVLGETVRASTGDVLAVQDARRIRFAAAAVLREGSYSEATGEVVQHFNQTVLEFERGRITSGPLLEAIATLGAMGNEEAAERLTAYLELVNTYTETERPFDTQIVLAVITNLEILGSPSSYNALFYTTLLENYPRRVRDRARQAMISVM
jgi:hypothetical protein